MTTATPDLDQLHTDAVNAVDAFTLDRLDFDPDLGCEIPRSRDDSDLCEKRAAWSLRCRTCSKHRIVCTDHLDAWTRKTAGHQLYCEYCGRTGTPEHVVEIVPLRSAT